MVVVVVVVGPVAVVVGLAGDDVTFARMSERGIPGCKTHNDEVCTVQSTVLYCYYIWSIPRDGNTYHISCPMEFGGEEISSNKLTPQCKVYSTYPALSPALIIS